MIRAGILDDARVIDLLTYHAGSMLESSPAGHTHFLDLSGLRRPDVTFYTAWDDVALLAMGALREHGERLGEIKSMRTVPDRLGEGHGRAMLRHIIAEARGRGMAALSLETGSGPAFEPALALYRSEGFVPCGPFADYRATDFNRFMTLKL